MSGKGLFLGDDGSQITDHKKLTCREIESESTSDMDIE